MIVYSCEFPLANAAALDQVPDLIREWVVGSQHYPWESVGELEFPEENEEIVISENAGHKASMAKVSDGECRAVGIKHVWIEEKEREWTTEVVASQRDGSPPWVSVKLFCDLLRPGGVIPQPRKPYVVRLLAESKGGSPGKDGPFTVANKPFILPDDSVDIAANIFTGKCGNEMPVVYVSLDTSGHPTVDVDSLAKWLSGIAHVVVEPSRQFTMKARTASGGNNCYGGAIGIYWPRGDGEHVRIMPWEVRRYPQTENHISQKIRSALLLTGSKNGYSWIEIKDLLAKRHLDRVRGSDTSSVEEYVAAFDEQNQALEAKIRELHRQNDALKGTLLGYQSAKSDSDVSLGAGTEQEFYNGEMSDLILIALKALRSNVADDSRSAMLIDSLLSANRPTGEQIKMSESIKRVFSDGGKLTGQSLSELKSLGFTITEEGKHYKAVYCDDQRFTFSLPKTPGDHRSGKNAEHDILNKVGL